MIDELSALIFMGCLLLYIILFIIKSQKKESSERATLNLVYKNWVQNRINDENLLYATQALRNFIMGNATFISGLLILVGFLVGVYNTQILSSEPFWGFNGLTLGFVQMATNLALIFFSLFNFILSIRYIVRVSILMAGEIKSFSDREFDGITVTRKAFISAQNHWLFGMRGLFFLFATLSWLIDAIFFILITIIIMVYLILFQDIWVASKKPE
jgi:uncharacterized membrane protein